MNRVKKYPGSANSPTEDIYNKSKKDPDKDADEIREVDDKLVGDDRDIADATSYKDEINKEESRATTG